MSNELAATQEIVHLAGCLAVCCYSVRPSRSLQHNSALITSVAVFSVSLVILPESTSSLSTSISILKTTRTTFQLVPSPDIQSTSSAFSSPQSTRHTSQSVTDAPSCTLRAYCCAASSTSELDFAKPSLGSQSFAFSPGLPVALASSCTKERSQISGARGPRTLIMRFWEQHNSVEQAWALWPDGR